ncbi:MAG: hypothetical protein CSB55_04925 [Candidatus Cloacimonadota bacterium]|nr:MAG: hypothetical protein CSB55_04925 [Candidatus Cloacimonadota bacterium]
MKLNLFWAILLNVIGLSADQSDSVFIGSGVVKDIPVPSMKMFAFKTLLALLLIAGLLYLFVFILKKISGYGTLGKIGNDSGLIDLLPLANKQGIYVVNILNIVYVVGFSQENIVLLDKITDEDTVRLLKMKKGKDKLPVKFEKLFKGKQNERKNN